jgi:exodeoxyribonuclease V gamma subunit
MSLFHMRLLFELGAHADFKLYQLNVCREFWEDVTTPEEDRWKKIRLLKVREDELGQVLETAGSDNALLKLWGKPGRENIKLLSELEEESQGKVAFLSDWLAPKDKQAPKKKTVLETVQEHILNRTAPGDGLERIEQDRTIQIAGCPSVWREAETVYNSIIDNMLETPELKLTDIAILVPNMPAYKAAIE